MKYIKNFESLFDDMYKSAPTESNFNPKYKNEFQNWNNLSEDERKKKVKEVVPRLGENALNIISKLETGKKYSFKELNAKVQTIDSLVIKGCLTHLDKAMLPNVKIGNFQISHDLLWEIQYYEDIRNNIIPTEKEYIRLNDKFKVGDLVTGNIKIRKDDAGKNLQKIIFINNSVGEIIEKWGENQYKVEFLDMVEDDIDNIFSNAGTGRISHDDKIITLSEKELKIPTDEQIKTYNIQKKSKNYNL